MGEAKRRQVNDKAFLAEAGNRLCCFCGQPAQTVDHVPPRIVFKGRGWPDGYRYPACKRCNAAKARDEQSIALLVRLMGLDAAMDDETKAIARAVHNNNPKVLNEMSAMGSASSKRLLRQRFGSSQVVDRLGLTGWKAVSFGPEAKRLLDRLCVWFAQTAFFKHNGAIFRGEVIWAQLPVELLHHEAAQTILNNLVGSPVMMRNGRDLSDQFFYRYFSGEGIFVSFLQFTRRPQTIFIICALEEKHVDSEKEIGSFWHRSGIIGLEPILSQ